MSCQKEKTARIAHLDVCRWQLTVETWPFFLTNELGDDNFKIETTDEWLKGRVC